MSEEKINFRFEKEITQIKSLGGWNHIEKIPSDFWSEKKLHNFILALKEEQGGELVLRSRPYHLVVEPTNLCNLRCPLCSTGLGNKSRPKGIMSLENFKQIIDESKEYILDLYLQNWGEPTLVQHLPEMAKYAADRGVWIYLSTNFSIDHSEEYLKKLMSSGIGLLHCDLDGTTPEIYEKYRVGGKLDLVLKNIRGCVKIKKELGLKFPIIEGTMLLMRHNEHQVEDFYRLAKDLGLDQWNLNHIQLDPNLNQEKWLPQDQKYVYVTYKDQNQVRPSCHWPWSGMTINWDGGISPCCIVDDFKADFGNLFIEGGIEKVWNNHNYVSARAEFHDRSRITSPNICNICKNYTHRKELKRFPNTYSLMIDEDVLGHYKKLYRQMNCLTLGSVLNQKKFVGEKTEISNPPVNLSEPLSLSGKKDNIIVPWARLYINNDELQEVISCVQSTWLAKGPRVDQFEAKVKSLIGSKHCIAINNGTSALDVALKVLGVQPEDEVIVPAFAYIATANSVLYQHATPIFADVDPITFNLDPDDVSRKITSRTKAVIAIDYAGQGADFKRLREVIAGKNIFLVEDAAPAFGGEQDGKKLCTFGDIAITSFHLAKSFTSVEGGMVFTDNDFYAEQARILINQGESPHEKYFHPRLGHNYRLSDLHAAVGLAQVARFEKVLAKRAEIAGYYTQKITEAASKIKIPLVYPENKHAWFLYPTLIEKGRDIILQKLKEKGICANISWPRPIYKQPYYEKYFKETCPVAEKLTQQILCLPIYYDMTKEEQDYVIKNLIAAVNNLN